MELVRLMSHFASSRLCVRDPRCPTCPQVGFHRRGPLFGSRSEDRSGYFSAIHSRGFVSIRGFWISPTVPHQGETNVLLQTQSAIRLKYSDLRCTSRVFSADSRVLHVGDGKSGTRHDSANSFPAGSAGRRGQVYQHGRLPELFRPPGDLVSGKETVTAIAEF